MAASFSPEQFGQYLLLAHLGRGGMADVYKARVEGVAGFARHVVVKRILTVHTSEPHFVEMFINEAKIAARLSHPNVVGVYELGEVNGELFMALEYVRGQDLLRVMRASAQRGELAPPPAIAAYIVREIARALGHAHDHVDENGAPRPIIHRDVSPQNVMIAYDGQVKLVDFGIAKAVTAFNEVTHTGSLKGKFGYMAPEQIDTGICTAQTDIFSAGVVLHEILTGRRLFKGQTDYDTMTKVKSAPLLPPSSLNPNIHPLLDQITMTALDRDPARRFQKAAHFARELDAYLLEARFSPEQVKEWLDRVIPREERDDGSESQAMLVPSERGTPSRSRGSGAGGPGTGPRTGLGGAGTQGSQLRRLGLSAAAHGGDSLGDFGAGAASLPAASDPGQSRGSHDSRRDASPFGRKEGSLSIASGARPPLEVSAAQRRRPLFIGAAVALFLASMGSVWLILRPSPPPAAVVQPRPEDRGAGAAVTSKPPPAPTPAATAARLRLDSDPSGAVVYAGPRRLGQTPMQLELPGDSLELTLSLQGRPELRYVVHRSDGAELTLRLPEEEKRGRRRKERRPAEGEKVPEQPAQPPPQLVLPQPPAQPPRKKLNVKILDEDERPGKVKSLDD